MAGWTNVSKPTESSVSTGSAGEPIGLLLALTIDTTSSSVISGWGNVNKPTVISWTNVSKPAVDGFTKVAKPTD